LALKQNGARTRAARTFIEHELFYCIFEKLIKLLQNFKATNVYLVCLLAGDFSHEIFAIISTLFVFYSAVVGARLKELHSVLVALCTGLGLQFLIVNF
jgi:hypothetical protein